MSSWPGTTDLAKDSWYFSASWRARPADDAPRCGERLQACLQGVAALHPSLRRWFDGVERVAIDAASLTELVEQEWNWEHPGGETGSYVQLWNGIKDKFGVAALRVGCGSTADYVNNCVGFDLPRPAATPELYRSETMLTLFRTMISAWQPQWCRVQPWSLREATGGELVDVLASWIIYLDRDVYTRKGALPSELEVIEGPGNGDLFFLAPTPEQVSLTTIDRLREAIVFPDEWSRLR